MLRILEFFIRFHSNFTTLIETLYIPKVSRYFNDTVTQVTTNKTVAILKDGVVAKL